MSKTCPKCKQSLPLQAFHASIRSADGLQRLCSECQNELRRVRLAARREAIRAALPADHEKWKRCAKCGETKERETAFHRNKSAPDGRQTYCIPCSATVQRDYLERHAEAVSLRQAEKRARPSTNGHKECRKCGVTKPLLAFYAHRSTKDGRNTHCSECQRAQARAWNAANRERIKARNAAYAAANPDRRKRDHRQWWLKMYGLNQESYAALLAEQGGACAICELPERVIDARTGEPRRLSVDHCHTTGRVRGLLCGRCNRSIGQFADDHERLMRASEYLRRAAE